MNALSKQEFYFETPLYKTFPLDIAQAATLLYGDTSIPDEMHLDCFCVKCEREATFKQNDWLPDEVQAALQVDRLNDHPLTTLETFFRQNPIIGVRFNCTRDSSHFLSFTFRFEFDSVGNDLKCTKIGQYPSSRDLLSNDLKKYRKVLDEQFFAEFRTAVGLYSFGVGVGSIVYLRRIIENVFIKKAEDEARASGSWNEDECQRLRVNDKIECLKDYLPPYFVENKNAYGVVSKGIHELSETDCISYFPILKNVIEISLDEIIAKNEQERKKQEIARQLQDITKQHKSEK